MVRQQLKVFTGEAFLYGLGGGLGRIAGLVLLPILTRVFGPADYGAIDLLNVGFLFLTLSLQIGAPSGFQRFYFTVEEGGERQLLVSSFLSVSAIFGVLAGLLTILAAPLIAGWIPAGEAEVTRAELHRSIVLLSYCIPLELLWNNAVLLLRMQRRPMVFTAANLISITITPLATLWLVVSRGRGVVGIYEAKLLSSAIVALFLLWITRDSWRSRPSLGSFRRQVAFGIPGHPGVMIRNLLNFLPRVVLSYFAPLSAVGLFGIAMRLSSPLRIFVQSFQRAWGPFAYANENSADEARLYSVVFKAYVAALLLASYTIALFAPEVLRVMAPGEFARAATLVPGVALFLGADGVVAIFGTALYTRGKVAWESYLSGLRLLLFALLALLLVPRWQAAGLVGALLVSTLAYLALYSWRVQRVMPFPQSRRRIVGLLAGLATCLVAANWIRQQPGSWQLPALGGLLLVPLLLTPYLILAQRERVVMAGEFRKIFGRGRTLG